MASARWFRAPRSMIAEIAKPSASAIKARLALGYHFLGEQTVKNIAKPVGAYKVTMEPRVTGAESTKQAKGAPVKSCAVNVSIRRPAVLFGQLHGLLTSVRSAPLKLQGTPQCFLVTIGI